MGSHGLESLESSHKAKQWGQSGKNSDYSLDPRLCLRSSEPATQAASRELGCELHSPPRDRMSLGSVSTGAMEKLEMANKYSAD